MWQRIKERFVRDPEGDPKSRLWIADVGRGYGYPNGPTDEERMWPVSEVYGDFEDLLTLYRRR
jgi:hypothetical protein